MVKQKKGAPFDQLCFLARKLKNEIIRNSRNTESLKKRENDLGTSPIVVKLHSERKPARFPRFTGQKRTRKQIKNNLNLTKKKQYRMKNGLSIPL